jgi:hypothetical protein
MKEGPARSRPLSFWGRAAAHIGLAALYSTGIAEAAETGQNDTSVFQWTGICGNRLEFYFDLKTLMLELVCGLALTRTECWSGPSDARHDAVTCANYLAMSPNQAREFFAWMSGWFNQRFGHITVGSDDLLEK